MVVFLAGLTAIPEECFQAARIDGAGALPTLVKVLLPLLAPTTFFVVVFSLINSFQAFIPPYVLTEGGPANATDLVVYHIYQVAFTNLQFSYGSAMSVVLFVLVFAVTGIMFRFWRHSVEF
jgi:ABC-type sugar transport system permease subunit